MSMYKLKRKASGLYYTALISDEISTLIPNSVGRETASIRFAKLFDSYNAAHHELALVKLKREDFDFIKVS